MTRRLTTIRQVVDANLCSGCGGCVAVAPEKIRMVLGSTGHLEPDGIEFLTTDEDERAIGICPGAIVEGPTSTSATPISPLWGPVHASFIAWSSDPVVRHAASSGGALSAMAAWLIASNHADAVLHVRASSIDPIRSDVVLSDSVDEVIAGSGSRYQPVAPLERLREASATGKRFVLVGRPCDISAARRLARGDTDLDRTIVFYLSIFCAGTPGMTGTTALLKKMDAEPTAVHELRFRGAGWPGQASARLADGSVRSLSYAESWGDVLNRHLPWRCKICPDGTGELADISFGDAWHLDEAGAPSFEDRSGRSIVLVRTERAAEFFGEARAAKAVEAVDLSIDELARMQPYQAMRKEQVVARLGGLKVAGRPAPQYSNLELKAARRRLRPLTAVRGFSGALRRVIRPRTVKEQ